MTRETRMAARRAWPWITAWWLLCLVCIIPLLIGA